MCASLLEPLQPFLVGATAASVQPPVHDALDAISLRSWLNSPWSGNMADELYKAANILRKFNAVGSLFCLMYLRDRYFICFADGFLAFCVMGSMVEHDDSF
jgi:hypothetical protein